MNDNQFKKIAAFLGWLKAPDEVAGHQAGAIDAAEKAKLARFARGELDPAERDPLVRSLLSNPALLAAFAAEINAAGKPERLSSGDVVPLGEEAEEGADEVGGRALGAAASPVKSVPRMRCCSCARVFLLTTGPDPEKLYLCRCGATNVMGLPVGDLLWLGMSLPRIPESYRPEKTLDTLFLTGPDGTVYEVPRREAAGWKVTAARRRELGHLPFDNSPRDPGEDEVAGHHGTPAGDPAGGKYHLHWEYGCYYSPSRNAYVVGYHRHPWADERAAGASEDDFS